LPLSVSTCFHLKCLPVVYVGGVGGISRVW
jgi:hypothetical protein